MTQISPLRYPGGKATLVDYFETLLKENLREGCTFYEPFCGGAALSLGLLSRGVVSKIVLGEIDPLISSFWWAVKHETDLLCSRLNKLAITLNTWRGMQRFLTISSVRDVPRIDLAIACIFLNRTNFSGILAAKPIGGMSQSSAYAIDCRFNKQRIISQIRFIASMSSSIDVRHVDAVSFVRENGAKIHDDGGFVYLDPPYYKQGRKLYRHHYIDRQHSRFAAEILRQKFPWVVSYDNDPFIRETFAGCKIIPISLNYVVREARRDSELLISNIPIPVPSYAKPKRAASIAAARDRDQARA